MAKKILLADDSVTIQKVVELTFMDEDYEVTAVSNGDEALNQLDSLAPDLVIADVHMPGADGYQVCREAKERRPGLPVLLLVGTFEPFQEEEVEKCGADGFLKKPFDSQELLRRVEDLLAGEAATEASDEPFEPSPEIATTAAEELTPWGTVEEELPDDVATPEEIWQGEALEVEEEGEPDSPPILGAAEELELEASPWTEAAEEQEEEDEAAESAPEREEVPAEVAGAHDQELEEAQSDGLEPPPVQAGVGAPEPSPAPAAKPASPEAPPGVARLSDEEVERIARRVAEILGEGALRDVAWEVVPDLAELVIKDRVRELERQLE